MGSMAANRDNLSQEVILFLLPTEIPEEYQSRIKQKYPGITIRWQSTLAPDRILDPSDIPKELFQDVTIICCKLLPDATWIPKVHYIQGTAAGPDRAVSHPLYKNPEVRFCSSNGVHPPQIAEWVIGSWIAHRHHFFQYAEQQRRGYWPTAYERATGYVESSPGRRMGILGYGAIGRQVAKLAQAMGVEVYAFTAREKASKESRRDDGYCVTGTGDPEGLIPSAWFHGSSREALHEFLAQDLDVLVMCLPLTDSTRFIMDYEQFDILSQKKKQAFLINVGRGKHINQEALISALEEGILQGAALDVTDPEPLPPKHPLWRAPNCFVTPHMSWQTPQYFTRVMEILELNLERLRKGEGLINLIDKELNY